MKHLQQCIYEPVNVLLDMQWQATGVWKQQCWSMLCAGMIQMPVTQVKLHLTLQQYSQLLMRCVSFSSHC
jgi:hypothetical protein